MASYSIALFLALYGVRSDVPELLRQVDSGIREEKLAALAQLERAAIDKEIGSHQGKIISTCARLLGNEDMELAEAACEVLEWLDANVVPTMVIALQSENAGDQGFAARVVGAVASRGRADIAKLDVAIPHLAKLMDGGDKYARLNAFFAMSSLGPKSIPSMVEAMDCEDYFFRVMLRGFLRHGELSIAPLAIALKDGDMAARRNITRALFQIAAHQPDVHPAMETHALTPLTAAIDDKDPLVRAQAIDALGRMGRHAAVSLDTIVAALEQPDPPYLAVAGAVAHIGARPKHLNALFNGARRAGKHAETERQQAVWAFGAAIGSVDEAGVPRVVLAADDPDSMTRETAMYALYSLGPKASIAVPTVVAKLNTGDAMAPRILGAIGPEAESAVPDLIARMQHEDWARPRGAFMIMHHSSCGTALASIGASALPALLEGLENENPQVRAGCLIAITEMDVAMMIPQAPLQRLLGDKHPIVRGLAIGALVKHGDSEASIAALKELLKDDHRGVAQTAQRAIEDLTAVQEKE